MRIEIRTRAVRLFFFSSRRRHTRSDRDWSSDVCSSDLDPVREVRARRPHLLAVDDEVVALIDGARPEARQIGAGAGLGEALAPDLVGVEDRREMATLLLLGAPVDESRAHQVQAHVAW